MAGHLAESGVHPTHKGVPAPAPREDLLGGQQEEIPRTGQEAERLR